MILPSNYWDLTPGVNVTIFPAPSKGHHGAFTPHGVNSAWKMITEKLVGSTLGTIPLKLLADISIEHQPGSATDTRADGKRIVIADGHVRAATLFAYATARLSEHPLLSDTYKLWFDFFLDALAEGDPIVPFDDHYKDLMRTLGEGRPSKNSVAANFSDTMYGFVAFVLAHEAAHILLGHGRKMADAKSVREMELEADQTAVDLTVAAGLFDGGAIASWTQWQAIRSIGALVNAGRGSSESSSHPLPADRLRVILNRLAELENRSDLDVESSVGELQRLIGEYQVTRAGGRMDELFDMRETPGDVSFVQERAFKRIMKLHVSAGQELA